MLTRSGLDLASALRDALSRLPHTTHVVVEVDLPRPDPCRPRTVVPTPCCWTTSRSTICAKVVALIGDRATVEASGGVNLNTVGDIARTGVDVISVGR